MKKALYTLKGKVIQGRGYGRTLGVPTANLDREDYARRNLSIPFGVYSGNATILPERKTYLAGIVIGPLDSAGAPNIEAHLLDFSGDLYGKELELTLATFLRPYIHFKSEMELREAIAQDLHRVREEFEQVVSKRN